jgi:acid stress-induced BolA-like protein IbaG/YrbA
MTAQEIERLIRDALPGARVRVAGDDGRHFEAEVIWSGFAGLSPVQQHQKIYAALGGRMGGEIHALQLTTRAA